MTAGESQQLEFSNNQFRNCAGKGSQAVIIAPELSSLPKHRSQSSNEQDRLEPFSCFSLSAENQLKISTATAVSYLDINSSGESGSNRCFDMTANMPSQVLPIDSSLPDAHFCHSERIEDVASSIKDIDQDQMLMPPPAFVPSANRLSLDGDFAVPLSITNHYDSDGNFISLSGVVGGKLDVRPFQDFLYHKEEPHQTPKLSTPFGSLAREYAQTPIMNNAAGKSAILVQDQTHRSSGHFERTPLLPTLDVTFNFTASVAKFPSFRPSNNNQADEDSLPLSLEILAALLVF